MAVGKLVKLNLVSSFNVLNTFYRNDAQTAPLNLKSVQYFTPATNWFPSVSYDTVFGISTTETLLSV